MVLQAAFSFEVQSLRGVEQFCGRRAHLPSIAVSDRVVDVLLEARGDLDVVDTLPQSFGCDRPERMQAGLSPRGLVSRAAPPPSFDGPLDEPTRSPEDGRSGT